jgi:hypothetical protein
LAQHHPRRKRPHRRETASRACAEPGNKRPAGGQALTLHSAGDAGWELVPSRCAAERADDIAEVEAMLAAGELEIARDELRWLLEDCHDFLDAHRLLGEVALLEGDISLARGHFGYAFRLGERAIQRADKSVAVPYSLPANRGFHESGKGLVHCLLQLDKREVAVEIVEFLLRCDPSDPLNARQLT